MNIYLGINLSGYQIMVGEITEKGTLLRKKEYRLDYFNQESAFEIIKALLNDYRAESDWEKQRPVAIGVGLIGRVDADEGIWYQIDPQRTHPINLAAELTEWTGIPCFIDNDVKSAARAVIKWGLGRKTQDFIYIYVGTGIAASLVINGRQVRGSHFNAGEVGHLRVGVQVGLRCPCGRMDCVETIASSVGLDRQARFLCKYYDTALVIPPLGERIQVSEVFRLCQQGDPLCRKLVDNAAEAMANLIMDLVRVSDPDTVILGGEVVADGFLLERIREKLQAVTVRFVTGGVVLTQLDPQLISLLGAGAVAIDGMEKNKTKKNDSGQAKR